MKKAVGLVLILAVCIIWPAFPLLAQDQGEAVTTQMQWEPLPFIEVFTAMNLDEEPNAYVYIEESPEMIEQRERDSARVNLPGPDVEGDEPYYYPNIDNWSEESYEIQIDEAFPNPQAVGSWQQVFTHTFSTTELPSVSDHAEPSVAFAEKKGFVTVNHSAARSADHGQTWTYVNPNAIAILSGYHFCCDQEVVYDPVYNLTFWMRLFLHNTQPGGALSLGVSKNGVNWQWYNVYQSSTLLPDFPHMTLSHNFLYVSFNEQNTSSQLASRVYRLPLIQFARGIGISDGSQFAATDWKTIALAKNARHNGIMYGVSNTPIDGSTPHNRLKVFEFPENSNSYTTHVIAVNGWGYKYVNSNFSCTLTDGTDPCARADDRVLGAAVSFNNKFNDPPQSSSDPLNQLWVAWNSGPDTGHSLPYTYLVKINMDNWTVSRYDHIYSSSTVFFYPRMTPNAYGDICLVIDAFDTVSNTSRTRFNAAIFDNDLQDYYAPYSLHTIDSGANGPPSNTWGDYNDVNPWWRNQAQCVTVGHVRTTSSQPVYVRFTNSVNFP